MHDVPMMSPAKDGGRDPGEESIVFSRVLPAWGEGSGTPMSRNDATQQAIDCLVEANANINKIWKRRDLLYKQACSQIKEFKDLEKKMKSAPGATIASIAPSIDQTAVVHERLETVILDYQRFGSQLRETVETNLRNQTTEYHLLDKVKEVREPDPDLRDQQTMAIVFNYYLSLDRIYELLVDKQEVANAKRLVRSPLLDKFFMQLEKSVLCLIEKARFVTVNPDRISEQELVHDVKNFFMRVFFSNLHFFVSVLFKEITEIVHIVEGVASLAIRYQSYYEQYKQLAFETEINVKQPAEGRNKLLHELTEAFTNSLTAFEARLTKISDAMFEPKKKGFFDGLFGGSSPQKQEETKLTAEGDFRFVAEEQKWHYFSEDEDAFFADLQSRRKNWVQQAEDLKARDVMKKDLLDFTLNHNLLNGVLYENTFRRLNLSVKESVDASRRVQYFFSLLEESLRGVLLLEKRKSFAKLQVKEHLRSSPETLMGKLAELEVVADAYGLLLQKVEREAEGGVDQIFAVLRKCLEKYRQSALKEVEQHRALKIDCEAEMVRSQRVEADPVQVAAQIRAGFEAFEKELYSVRQVFKTNFFSLYEPDIEKVEINFTRCFGGLDRVFLNALKHDRNQTQGDLLLLIVEFEEIDYFLKKLVSVLKKVSIGSVGVISQIRFGSANFLTDDQGALNEAEVLLTNLKENQEELRLVSEVVAQKVHRGVTGSHSKAIFHYFSELFAFASNVTNYLLQVYETLYQQWTTANKDFRRLCKEKDAEFWPKLATKFQACQLDEGAISSIVQVRNEDLEDLYAFVEEVYANFCGSVRSGLKILDLREECQGIVGVLLADYDAKRKNPQLIVDGLSKAIDALNRKESISIALDVEIKDYKWPEGYLFVLGDGVKKYSLEDPSCCPTTLIAALKKWVVAISSVVKAWRDRAKLEESLEKETKSIDHALITKWFSAKRCQDHVAGLVSRPHS